MVARVIWPLQVWQSGTNENSLPANDNALTVQVVSDAGLGFADAEPMTPAEDDQWVVGTSWGGFTTNNVVIYKSGTWLEFEAFEGWLKTVDNTAYVFDGSDWVELTSGGGGAVDSVNGQTGTVQIDAEDVPYDNATSGLIATEVQAAIDEIAAGGGGGGMTNPMTTEGDIIVGGTDGAPTRLSAGATAGHVLTSNGAGVAPSYQAAGGGSAAGKAVVNAYRIYPSIGSVPLYLNDLPTSSVPLNTGTSLTANRLYYVPFMLAEDITIATLGISTFGTSAGNKARAGIYDTAKTGFRSKPGSLLVSTGDLSLTSAGQLTTAAALSLSAGVLYWAAVVESVGVPTLNVPGSSPATSLGRISLANHNNYNCMFQALGGGWTALPSTAAPTDLSLEPLPVLYATT